MNMPFFSIFQEPLYNNSRHSPGGSDNEDVAFLYHFPETANGLFLHVKNEVTNFRMPKGTMAWYEVWAQGPYH